GEALAGLEPGERRARVRERVSAAAGAVLNLAADRIDLDVPLKDHGLDSLMTVELAALLGDALGIEVSSMDLPADRGLASVADLLAGRLEQAAPRQAAPRRPPVVSV